MRMLYEDKKHKRKNSFGEKINDALGIIKMVLSLIVSLLGLITVSLIGYYVIKYCLMK